jgi:L-rhamnose-H+ transport protein
VKGWSWESFWLAQGVFAWLIFPLLGALLAVPAGGSLWQTLSVDTPAALKAAGFGMLWGIGGLTFGLSMRYLGVALGQSLALGTCSAFGTVIPAVMKGTDLFRGSGLILLAGVCLTLAGIAVIGYAGGLRSRNMTDGERKAAVKDFALTKGLLVALLAGVMSACFALGLEAGEPLVAAGASELFKTLPATLMVTCGGFVTNAAYCLFQNVKNGSYKDYFSTPGGIFINNMLFCALAGLLWYSQFFGLGMGKSFLEPGSVMMAFSWCILMGLNVTFSNVWGIVLKEWKGVSGATVAVLVAGLAILVFSLVFPNLF